MSSTKNNNDNQYSHERKEKIARKIGKIKKKEHLINIFKIIRETNKDVAITENNNGVFILFNLFSDDTYKKIENYLNKIKVPKTQSEAMSESSMSEYTEYHPYSAEEYPHHNGFTPKLKYSNKERNLIKRKLYDKAINENGSIETNNDLLKV